MVRSRIRITAHELVGYEFGPTRMTPTVVETALAQVRRRGFVPSFVPPPEAYHQHMILVLVTHPFAALYRALAPDGSPTPVPRGLIESRTGLRITQMFAGMMLARYGLAILRATDYCVILRGTSTEMAHDANISRYMNVVARPCWMLVERATGLVVPPAEIDDDLRLRSALAYDEHNVAVPGLLDGDDNCALASPWQFLKSELETDEMTPPF